MTFARYRKSADQAFSTTTLVDVTDLSAPLLAGEECEFAVDLVFSSAATTTGIRVAFNGPGTPALFVAVTEPMVTSTSWPPQHHTAYNQGTATAGVTAANTNYLVRARGILRNGATAGNLTVRVASEVAGSAVTVRQGSVLRIL